jgi:hypothetical protein
VVTETVTELLEVTPGWEVSHRPPGATGSSWLPASLASGYQKFALNLASRLAVWRLARAPRPDAFIIDEGFGACDADHLESMASALEALACAPGGPRLVFLVSHVDALKARVERALALEVAPGGSRVVNAEPAPRAPPPAASAAASAPASAARGAKPAPAPPFQPPPLVPDPKNAGRMWCELCQQTLSGAVRVAAHPATKKHQAACERAAKRL